jgi:3-oxoadipate enol-lactonase/4-carboxymuconolactone decarboxylase
MAFLTISDGAQSLRIYHRVEGADDSPVLILSHSLGQDHNMWNPQIAEFARFFKVVAYDMRGHGASDVPSGDATVERLGRDVLALADGLGIQQFHFCGLSIGGMIGQWIAGNAPERLIKLVLANTSSNYPDPSPMATRYTKVLEGGLPAIREMVMGRFFTPEAIAARPAFVADSERVLLATDPRGYAACVAAVRDLDTRAYLPKITTPTLLISGDRDLSTPWAGHGDFIARSIPGCQVVHLPAAHLSSLERPRSFTVAVLEFLVGNPGPDSDRNTFETGMKMRRSVLGNQHVDRSMNHANEITRDFQTLATQYAWGSIWGRPAFPPGLRRILALTTLAAMGRWEEFRMHTRLGLERELEPCDVKELLLQLGVYAGVPVPNTGLPIVREEWERITQQGK